MSSKFKLHECFFEALEIEDGSLIQEAAYQQTPAWDSVGHMRLISAIEEKFSVMFSTEEIFELGNYASTCLILKRHGVVIQD